MISPALTFHNPSGLRPVAAAGAGVQFATVPIHGMRTRDSLPADDAERNRYWDGGIPFQQVPARVGDIGATVGAC